MRFDKALQLMDRGANVRRAGSKRVYHKSSPGSVHVSKERRDGTVRIKEARTIKLRHLLADDWERVE
jgi:hypothetical protein